MINKFYTLVARYVAEQDGVTGLEYGLIAGGISAVGMTAFVIIGDDLAGMMDVFNGFFEGAQEL